MKYFAQIKREDITRDDCESAIDFLLRNTMPEYLEFINHLESMLDDYPENHREELISRMKVKGYDDSFNSAFFELFLYCKYKAKGFHIEIHPGQGTHVDFFMKRDEVQFELEAFTTESIPTTLKKIERQKAELEIYLNRNIQSEECYLRMNIIRYDGSNIKKSNVKAYLNKFIKSSLTKDIYIDEDLEIEFEKMNRKKIHYKNNIIEVNGPFDIAYSSETTLNVLRKKLKKYDSNAYPLIFAINSLVLINEVHKDHIRENLRELCSPNKNSSLSAVLMFNRVFYGNLKYQTVEPHIFINRNAKNQFKDLIILSR